MAWGEWITEAIIGEGDLVFLGVRQAIRWRAELAGVDHRDVQEISEDHAADSSTRIGLSPSGFHRHPAADGAPRRISEKIDAVVDDSDGFATGSA